MQIKLIAYNSPQYHDMVELRMEMLRRPLGLHFTPEQLQQEKNDILIGAYEETRLVGCCVLTPRTQGLIQLRQMAVLSNTQQSGIGKSIVHYAEEWSKKNGFDRLMMHARKVALGFYEKCGYAVIGEEFTEVGLPHVEMAKSL